MAKAKTYVHTDYLQRVYNKKLFAKTVKKTITLVKQLQKQHKFTAIAFSGSSGAALAFPVAYATGLSLIHARKRDNSHWVQDNPRHKGSHVEGSMGAKKYIIIDDFISSGTTVDRILRDVNAAYKYRGFAYAPKCVAIVVYSTGNGRSTFQGVPVMCSATVKV
jgi:adenine/guanine phosphoribosyltransferase-like PRPP-binding protein